MVLCNKSHEKANEVASMQIIGDEEGNNVVLIDGIVDTAGTITKAANIMLEAGAQDVYKRQIPDNKHQCPGNQDT